jgi:hypothetical protein
MKGARTGQQVTQLPGGNDDHDDDNDTDDTEYIFWAYSRSSVPFVIKHGIQICKVCAIIKKSWTAHKGWSSRLGN